MRSNLVVGIVLGAALGAAVSFAHAQEPPTLRADIVSVSEDAYPAARAIVNIEDTGSDIRTLATANFTVTVGGQPATVLSADLASSQNAPLSVLLLMDSSGSMTGEPIAQSKEAAKGLVSALGPNDRVAVMSFADSVTLVQDYTVDRAAINSAIEGLTAKGNTALYDATGAAAYKAGTAGSGRRAIILLSDGAQDGVKLKTTRDQALSAIAGAQVPVFAIGEGKSLDVAYLTQVASSSRGRYLEAPKPTDLVGLFASIGELLTSQFIVRFDAGAAVGAAESPVTITIQSNATSVTADSVFRPGPGFVAAPIALTLSGISAGESFTDSRVVTAVPDRAEGLTRVAFYVDDVNIYETDTAPYTFTYDPRAYGASTHTLKAAAIVGAQTFESPPVSFTSSAPIAPAGSSGGLPLLPIAVGTAAIAAALVIGGLLFTVVRRLRRGGMVVVRSADQRITPWATRVREVVPPDDGEALDGPAPTVAIVEDIGEPLGVLVARGGPLMGTEYVVGAKPVSIGSGARCAVRISDMTLSAEEARIWVRDGHLMLHKMTRLNAIAEDGVSGGWTILEPGDHVTIGEHRFEFRIWTPPLPEVEEDTGPIPNILRETPRAVPNEPRVLSPAPATGLGVIWPREDASAPQEHESGELDAQAS